MTQEKESMEFTSLSLEKGTIEDWLDQLETAYEFMQNHSKARAELLTPVIDFFTDVLDNGYFQVYNLKDLEKEGCLRMVEKDNIPSPTGRA
jgi:hypothetical protein